MWVNWTIRLRPQAIKLYNYLQFSQHNLKKLQMKKFQLMDIIINDKFPELINNTYLIDAYNTTREVKGIKMQENTLDKINKFIDQKNNYLKAEILEICLYLWAKEYLNKEEFKIFGLSTWNVRQN